MCTAGFITSTEWVTQQPPCVVSIIHHSHCRKCILLTENVFLIIIMIKIILIGTMQFNNDTIQTLTVTCCKDTTIFNFQSLSPRWVFTSTIHKYYMTHLVNQNMSPKVFAICIYNYENETQIYTIKEALSPSVWKLKEVPALLDAINALNMSRFYICLTNCINAIILYISLMLAAGCVERSLTVSLLVFLGTDFSDSR